MAGNGAGNKPLYDGDKYIGPVTRNIMEDPRTQPTLRENLALGVGKAHRSVTYSHYDYRNFKRSSLGTTGKL